ncbi:hypothetical protein APS56_01125 [Pseudalgibacter alginicilyticus]|uniref:Sel1 repeat protein n=1 Tax=Pseudalgibacter alginicilyticus TaxID=1736674 RepID=A0A0P0CU31_9FLAO|nr:hypothetical protein APS56_01125 [Pseudalgibacter alginicilyticus]
MGTFYLNGQNYVFELLGNTMTEKEYDRFNYKSGTYTRNYGQNKINKLLKQKNIDFLKKVAFFKYLDFYFGDKKKYNLSKGASFSWFMAASNLGDKEAKYNIGLFYLFGYGIEQDYNTAVTIFSELLEEGFEPAREVLGYCFYRGYGLEKNIDKGSYLILSRRDKLVQPLAKVVLGEIYLNGYNIKKDTLKAVEIFHEKIRFHNSQNQLISLLYSESKVSVKKKLIELEGHSYDALSYLYRESINRNSSKLTPEFYYDYSKILLRSNYASRTWDQTQEAINYYKKYKDTVDYSVNEDDWYYGHNLYYKNYLRGDIYLAKTGVEVMEKAATNDNQFARELSKIYRGSAYQHIKNSKKANFWELKADLYENSNTEISTIIALATGNGIDKNITKAYQLAKNSFERSSEYDKDYDAFYYLYFSLCKKSKTENSDYCLSLEKAYAKHIYCWNCDTKGRVSCDTCDGLGKTETYRNNTEQCRICNGFGYLKCKPYQNIPRNYIIESIPSNYKEITHLH